MANDLFVMLKHNSYADLVLYVEQRVTVLVANRHEYPIWPTHNEPHDAFEREYHGWIRRVYYESTIYMIRTLRRLRELGE